MNIRNSLIAAGSALALSMVATGAFAATVSATANATVTVISPTTITKVQDMVFGTVVRPTSGSNTVTLGTNDAVTMTGAGNGSVVASTTSACTSSEVLRQVGSGFSGELASSGVEI